MRYPWFDFTLSRHMMVGIVIGLAAVAFVTAWLQL